MIEIIGVVGLTLGASVSALLAAVYAYTRSNCDSAGDGVRAPARDGNGEPDRAAQ